MTLTKMVVITSMMVRFTERAASKKKDLKKVVAKVMRRSRREGKKEVIISLKIIRFITTLIQMPSLGSLLFLNSRLQSVNRKRFVLLSCSIQRSLGDNIMVGLSCLPTVILIGHT